MEALNKARYGQGTGRGWGAGSKELFAQGLVALRKVFVTLSTHLVAAVVRTWAAFAVLRAWDGWQYQSKRETGSTAYKFGFITADEMESLFVTF